MVVLFDFDGVIADSSAAMARVLEAVAQQAGKPPLSLEALRTHSTRALLKKWNIRFYQVPRYVRMAKAEFLRHRDLVQPHPACVPALRWLQQNDIPTAIVSSNTTDFVQTFAATHYPELRFRVIQGDVSLFAKHRALKRVAKMMGVRCADCVVVGDETRDIVAAHKVGANSCAVTWGKETAELLQRSNPGSMADDGAALLQRLQSLRGECA